MYVYGIYIGSTRKYMLLVVVACVVVLFCWDIDSILFSCVFGWRWVVRIGPAAGQKFVQEDIVVI
jgi:hypothetical protein